MVLTSSSFPRFIRQDRIISAELGDGHRYSTSSTLLESLWLVDGWFDPDDPSTRRDWHQCESWTNGVVFSRCNKLHLGWCSDQWQKFPCFFFPCGLLLMKTNTLIYKCFRVLWITKTTGAMLTTQKKIVHNIFGLCNPKYPSPYIIFSDYIIRNKS